MRWIFLCVLVFAVSATPSVSSFEYDLNGSHYTTSVVQMWYEGYWKQVRPKKLLYRERRNRAALQIPA